MNETKNLTAEEVHSLLLYEDGALFWKQLRKGKTGKRAGSQNDRGYRNVVINGKQQREHRLIWLMHYGSMPKGEIDHIDGNRSNNRIENLRDVTKVENMKNAKRNSRNKSGVMGVAWHKGRCRAQVTENSHNKLLGSFDNLFDAVAARKSYEASHGYHENHGRTCLSTKNAEEGQPCDK